MSLSWILLYSVSFRQKLCFFFVQSGFWTEVSPEHREPILTVLCPLRWRRSVARKATGRTFWKFGIFLEYFWNIFGKFLAEEENGRPFIRMAKMEVQKLGLSTYRASISSLRVSIIWTKCYKTFYNRNLLMLIKSELKCS